MLTWLCNILPFSSHCSLKKNWVHALFFLKWWHGTKSFWSLNLRSLHWISLLQSCKLWIDLLCQTHNMWTSILSHNSPNLRSIKTTNGICSLGYAVIQIIMWVQLLCFLQWVGTKQQEFQVNSMQLLYYQVNWLIICLDPNLNSLMIFIQCCAWSRITTNITEISCHIIITQSYHHCTITIAIVNNNGSEQVYLVYWPHADYIHTNYLIRSTCSLLPTITISWKQYTITALIEKNQPPR